MPLKYVKTSRGQKRNALSENILMDDRFSTRHLLRSFGAPPVLQIVTYPVLPCFVAKDKEKTPGLTIPTEPLKCLEKRGKTPPQNKEFLAGRKKARKSPQNKERVRVAILKLVGHIFEIRHCNLTQGKRRKCGRSVPWWPEKTRA